MSSEEDTGCGGSCWAVRHPRTPRGEGGPSFRARLKYGFLEHDPHSEYHCSLRLMLPKWESGKCKGTGSSEDNDFCLQIDGADAGVPFVGPSPPFIGCSLGCPRKTAVPLSPANLRCALWLVTIDFLPTTLHFDTSIPVIYV